MNSMAFLEQIHEKMKSHVEKLSQSLSAVRTGRAHPSLLENISVMAYGAQAPLKHLASVLTEDAQTLVVNVYDSSLVASIDKAIRSMEGHFNPRMAGQSLKVPIPPLTQARREALVKQVKGMAEQTKVIVRNVRREANDQLKQDQKAKLISEDVVRQSEQKIQKLTDSQIQAIDKLVQDKEQQLLTI